MFLTTASKKGFSMVELLVAVSIMGIIAVAAVPSYNSFIEKGLKSSIRSDITGLQKAWLAFGFEDHNFCISSDGTEASIYNVGYGSVFAQKRYGKTVHKKDGKAASFFGFGNHLNCGGRTVTSGGRVQEGTAAQVADIENDLELVYGVGINTADNDFYVDTDCAFEKSIFKMGVLKKIRKDEWQTMAINEEGFFRENDNVAIITLTGGNSPSNLVTTCSDL